MYSMMSVMPWYILWCHHDICDAMMYSVMWSVVPWFILWCQYVVCDAMMYSVTSAWCLWCHHDICDAMMYSVMWSVVPWCIIWCQDMWDDFVMSRHVLWCCVSFCDSCDWKGTGGKTQTNRSWNGVASELAVPTCPTGNALMPTALSWGVNSIYLLWNYGHFPPHHPPQPPSHHSISVHHAPPPIHLLDQKNKKIKMNMVLPVPGCWTSTQTSVWIKRKIFFFFVQSRSDLVMVCVSVSYEKSVEENIKVNSEVKLLRSTIGTVPFSYTSVWW